MGTEAKPFEMWWPGTELRRRQPFQGCIQSPLSIALRDQPESLVLTKKHQLAARFSLRDLPAKLDIVTFGYTRFSADRCYRPGSGGSLTAPVATPHFSLIIIILTWRPRRD